MLIKLADYAESVGRVPQAVRKAIAEGRIKKGAVRQGRSWMIDPEIAGQEWGLNTAPQYQQSEAIKAGRQRQLAGGGEGGGYRGPSMSQAQTIKAGYQAKLLALEYEERSGQLVRVEDVRRQQFEAGRQVRDAVLRIGPQMIGEIAKAAGGLTPEQRAEVLMVIERHQVQALEALVDGAGRG